MAFRYLALFLVFFTFSASKCYAANFYIYSQINGGGDLIVSGGGYYEYDVTAGGGLEHGIGGQFSLNKSDNVHLNFSYGFNEDDTEGLYVAKASFKSNPIEISIFKTFHNNRHWLGAGVLIESSTDITRDYYGYTADVEDALGFVIQYGYRWKFGLEVGVKSRFIEYDVQEGYSNYTLISAMTRSRSYDGDSLSTFIRFNFN